MAVDDIKRLGRSTQGVIVMRLKKSERVSTLAPVVEADQDEVVEAEAVQTEPAEAESADE
jgi:DNA gyrase/topoisomerase IV subunit A